MAGLSQKRRTWPTALLSVLSYRPAQGAGALPRGVRLAPVPTWSPCLGPRSRGRGFGSGLGGKGGLGWPGPGTLWIGGPLSGVGASCDPWPLGDVGEVVLGGRAVRNFLRGGLLYLNSDTFQAKQGEVGLRWGGGDEVCCLLPLAAHLCSHLRAVEGVGARGAAVYTLQRALGFVLLFVRATVLTAI